MFKQLTVEQQSWYDMTASQSDVIFASSKITFKRNFVYIHLRAMFHGGYKEKYCL